MIVGTLNNSTPPRSSIPTLNGNRGRHGLDKLCRVQGVDRSYELEAAARWFGSGPCQNHASRAKPWVLNIMEGFSYILQHMQYAMPAGCRNPQGSEWQ